jgi:hypothetical protein
MRRLGPCVAIVVAMHGALLLTPTRPAAALALSTAVPAALQMRLVELQPLAPMRAETRRLDPVVVTNAAVPKAEPRTSGDTLVAPPPVVVGDTFVPSSPMPVAQEPTLLGLSLPGQASEDDLFVARSLLSVPPTPLAPLVIDYPPFDGEMLRYVGELTLFIDETGAVVRVRAEGTSLPPRLEEAARSAFLSIRFRPGELMDHGAVKSRIRVEVVFEGGAPPSTG